MFNTKLGKPEASATFTKSGKPEASASFTKLGRPEASATFTKVELYTAPAMNRADIGEADATVLDS